MSIRTYDCPQCGAPVKFQSSIAVFVVCEHCRSMVVRRDANVESMGTMAELPPDLSPLQIGTRGEWQGSAFELVGRVRVEWEEGSWTEWCALFPNDKTGWVAEAQGFFMVSFETSEPALPSAPGELEPGASLRVAGRPWTVVDVKRATCLAGEGELPFVAPPGQQRLGADLTGADGAFATIEFYDGEAPRLYVGSYAEFEELRFANLRPVPGWTADTEQIRYQTSALNCPSCGAAVKLRAAGQSMAAVCGSCGSIIDIANPQWQVVQKGDEKARKLNGLLPIGVRGQLQDVDWEVIGLVRRADKYSSWQEYLLFNPWRGFRWLVTYKGHWSWVQRVPDIGDLSGQRIRLDGRDFRLFAKGEARVKDVLGEFYWKVKRGEVAELEDYIRPPEVLSKETYPGLKEFTWSLGEYLEHTAVAGAFGIKEMPVPAGPYLNEPNPFANKTGPVWGRALLFIAILFVIQLIFAAGTGERPIFDGDYVFTRAEPPAVVTTPHFQVDGRQGPVRLAVTAGVDNQWIGFDFDLVNAQTNETFPAQLEVSYYHGYDDGEWSEGGQTNSVSVPAVPAGEYFLNVETDADPALQQLTWHLAVTRGGLFWSNFLIGVCVLLAYPIYLSIRRHGFERQRWSESDFSPYGSSDD
ncbi:MAG: hypothetical protein QOE70_1380 [Chthoniobacter sp.]|nr:hypothetical protein [Chthoniobacter sp.]